MTKCLDLAGHKITRRWNIAVWPSWTCFDIKAVDCAYDQRERERETLVSIHFRSIEIEIKFAHCRIDKRTDV